MSPVTFDRIPEGVVKEEGIERRRKGEGETKMKIVTRAVCRRREKVGIELRYESGGRRQGGKMRVRVGRKDTKVHHSSAYPLASRMK